MKNAKKIICSFLLALTVLLTAGTDCHALEYTYTVTVYAGTQGTFDSSEAVTIISTTGSQPEVVEWTAEKIKYAGVKDGDQVRLNMDKVTVTNGKYYVKGMRIGGRDNTKTNEVVRTVHNVTSDGNYVVSYGVAGDQVRYTVRYLSETGETLREEETFYGPKDELVIVGYHYIEGYQPQAYNLGKTLTGDESENVYDFIYTPRPEVVTTTVVETEGPATATGTAGGNATQAETAGAGTGVAGTGAQNNPEEATEPEEYENIDENQTPQANAGEKGKESGGSSDQTMIIGGIGAGGILLIVLWMIMKKKKKENEAG